MRYAIVVEKAACNFSAYVPDLPGCIAAGATEAALEIDLQRAIAFHLGAMQKDGVPIPLPTSTVKYIDVALPV